MAGPDPAPANPPQGSVPDLAPFAVRSRHEGEAVVLAVSGDVDMTSGPSLREEIHRQLAGSPTVLVVDLGGVTFFGTAGLGALVDGRNAAEPDTALRLVVDNRIVLRPIQITGLDQLFAVFDSLDEALAAD